MEEQLDLHYSRLPLGSNSLGKFVQHRLDKEKPGPDIDMTDEKKRETWSARVRLIAQHGHRNGRDLNWQEFINYWSRIWPNQAVKWFMPNKGKPM